MAASMRAHWILAVAVLLATPVFAQGKLRPLPPQLRTVSDETGVLSAEQGRTLASALADTAQATGVPVILVIAETTKPESIEDYSERLAKRWAELPGLDTTRAVFIIVSLHDREMKLMHGRALGLTEALQREDPTEGMGPHFREGRHFEGLMQLVARVRSMIERNASLPMTDRESGGTHELLFQELVLE